MILLFIFTVYMARYRSLDFIIKAVRSSISIDIRELLYYDNETLENETLEIKKYIYMAIIIIVFIDLIILKLDLKKIYIVCNSIISPFVLLGIYKLEIKAKYDKSYRKIHMELAIILQQLYCLLSIDYALEESILESSANVSIVVLKKELDDMYNKLSRGYDLCLTLNSFFEKINSQYILRFRSVLISHYYYGGSSSKENFISLIYDLLEYRVLLLREDGEKIKIKLIIPIIIIFVSTIVSLALPIILNLNI